MQKPEPTSPGGMRERDPEQALLAGLRQVPVPPVSSTFDDRVLACLETPARKVDALGWSAVLRETLRAWWNGPSVQWMLSGATCAVILTLGAYALSVHTPISDPVVAPSGAGVASATKANSDEWYRATLEAGSYRGLLFGMPAPAPKPVQPKPEPDRRRGSGRSQTPDTTTTPRATTENGREA